MFPRNAFLLLVLLPLLLPGAGVSQSHLVPQKTFDALAAEYSGEAAQEYDRAIVEYHRIQGSPMMADVAEKVVLAKLKVWGVEARLEQFPSDGKTRYQTMISPMGWDMRGGELWVESVSGDPSFVPLRLCRYSDVPMCVSTYSKGGKWSGELVEVGAGTSNKDYEGKDVRGKVALAYGYAGDVVRQAVLKHGAVGVVIYPAADDRPEHPDMVRYNGIWPRAEELAQTSGGFQISANQYTRLRELMARGAVRVRGTIDATLGDGQLTLVHAWIRGSETPDVEVLITCHLDHPKWSANDNASGSAAVLEMARTLHTLIAEKKLPWPRATIHFMWVPEYYGSTAYVTKHPEARACSSVAWDDPRRDGAPYQPGPPCIVANLNLDMVGEDTVKTNSRFYFTRTPDSTPGFLNALMADVLGQTRAATLFAGAGTRNHWPTEMTGYMQGSDHDVFLGLGIASTMLGHDPDWTHHTSEDTVDKTDASEFRRVGTLATAVAYWLGEADRDDWQRLQVAAATDLMAERNARIGEILAAAKSAGAQRRLQTNRKAVEQLAGVLKPEELRFLAASESGAAGKFDITRLGMLPSSSGAGPRRLMIPPFDKNVFEGMSAEDRRWWQAQQARFASDSPEGGLPMKPPFEVVMFETVNFMDGKRSTAEIADLLAAEFATDIDAAWVDRLVGILGKLKLVNPKP
jgi:hypothetical protein